MTSSSNATISAEACAEAVAAATTLEDRIKAICGSIAGRIAFSTSLGLEDQAILHAIAVTNARFDIFCLDTGRHFPETFHTIDRTERRYGLRISVVAPDSQDLETLVRRDGIFGFKTSIEARKACCEIRKVRPLHRHLKGASAWVTGLRRGQSDEREEVAFCEADQALGLLKFNPLADWPLETLLAYISANKVPTNSLHAEGFPSIGCQPCTRAVRPGEPIRAGRWWWESPGHKECGLHETRFTPATI